MRLFLINLSRCFFMLFFPFLALSQTDSLFYEDGSIIILESKSLNGDDSPRLSLEGNFAQDNCYGENLFMGGLVQYKNPTILMSGLSIGPSQNGSGKGYYVELDNSLFLFTRLKSYKREISFFSEDNLTDFNRMDNLTKRVVIDVYGAKIRPVKRVSMGLNMGVRIFKIIDPQVVSIDYYPDEITFHSFQQQRFFIGLTFASFRFFDIRPVAFIHKSGKKSYPTRRHKRSTYFKADLNFNLVNLYYDSKKIISDNSPQRFLSTFRLPNVYSASIKGNTTFQGRTGHVYFSYKLGVEVNNFYSKTAGLIIGYGVGYNFYYFNPPSTKSNRIRLAD